MTTETKPLPKIEYDAQGVPARAWVPSSRNPDVVYECERLVGGRWTHTDTRCEGFVNRGDCYHLKDLYQLTAEVIVSNGAENETAVISVQVNPLALLDSVDLEQVLDEKLAPSEKHIYSFRVKGQQVEGVSIDGVRDAARALSTKGEAIREQWVRLDREDDRDAYFIACAARYAVAPDGREICMDTAIRAKRQPKYTKLREPNAAGETEQFNEYWYEIGVAKAVRNATEALLPEALKDYIKEQSRALARSQTPPPPATQQTQAQRRATQHRTTPAKGEKTGTPATAHAQEVIKRVVKISEDFAPPVSQKLLQDINNINSARTVSGYVNWYQFSDEQLTQVDALCEAIERLDPPAQEPAQGALDPDDLPFE